VTHRPTRRPGGTVAAVPDPPGPLLASGRTTDVFDLGDGTVLRRYRAPRPADRPLEAEARTMAWARSQGVPVPAVHDVDHRDLVMDLVPGPTMLEDLQRRPWRLVRHGRTLANLQMGINALTAPSWVALRPGVPDGDALLHLDLHPLNVILGPRGPVVIDWTNASRGAPDFDASLTCVVMGTFEAEGFRDRVAAQVLVRAFTRARGRAVVRRRLPEACSFRSADPNVTPGERAAIRRVLSGFES
jgi:aminoglycoside phosphotransferase (APT) family kinase protein